jgi:predicted HTH transcriptional regulator
MKLKSKEQFAQFLEEPTREKLKGLIHENLGESNNIEFKEDWIEDVKLSKHIVAIANSGGGVIIIGVAETEGGYTPKGITNIQDKAVLYKKVRKYLPDELEFDVLDFHYKESEYAELKGKKFQVIVIPNQDKYVPFVTKKDGNGIRVNAIYCRQGTNSEEVTYHELQKILNRRINTEFSNSSAIEISEHISQLKALYQQIPTHNTINSPFQVFANLNFGTQVPNPNFPEESFEAFILRMIEQKKSVIERELKK